MPVSVQDVVDVVALSLSVEKVGIGKKSVRVWKKSFRQKIGKPRQTLKNTKYIHFFF
jgi:hypothetical protein